MSRLSELLDEHLVTIGGTPVTVSTALTGTLIVAVTYLASSALQMGVGRALRAKGVHEGGGVRVATRLFHYLVVAVSIAIALQTAGVELTALFAASAVFAVGLGFAMQNIAQNFVSGVILLVERTIRPGDIVEFDGRVARVTDMGIRATIVRTRDEEDLIVPNAVLVQQAVKNLTLSDKRYRVRITVGVAYQSDLVLVRKTLQETANSIPFKDGDEDPRVLLTDFGASSVEYEVAVYSSDPWNARLHQSELREAVWAAFQAAEIVISFPQVDVHADSVLIDALRSRAA